MFLETTLFFYIGVGVTGLSNGMQHSKIRAARFYTFNLDKKHLLTTIEAEVYMYTSSFIPPLAGLTSLVLSSPNLSLLRNPSSPLPFVVGSPNTMTDSEETSSYSGGELSMEIG
jgi:hypothetical protein